MTLRLETTGLVTEYRLGGGSFRPVENVSLRLEQGRTLALVGESGCGKSTVALSLMQLLPRRVGRIAGGSIRLDGEELVGAPASRMRAIRGGRMAMIFQEPMTALNPVMTVGAQIVEMLREHGGSDDPWAEAVAGLARLGIPEPERIARAYPHQLSGGMRQRVVIAIAVACRPGVIIADEPTTALDVTVQAQILEIFKTLQAQQGLALLLITHDLGVVAEVADEVAVMYAGRVVERGPVAAIFHNPQHPYTIGLLSSMSVAEDGLLPSIASSVPAPSEWPSGCRFHTRCPFALPACSAAVPPLVEVGSDHAAACIRSPFQ